MIVAIRDAEEGMVLRTSVKDRSGRTLLPEGATLAGRHIEKLQRWGIEKVDVVAPEGEDTPDPQSKTEDEVAVVLFRAELAPRLDARFEEVQDDALMRRLRKIAEEHLVHNPKLWDIVRSSKP